MELKSEPQYEQVQYTDIDVAYSSGVRSLTLRNGHDDWYDEGDTLRVEWGNGETVEFSKKSMHWISFRPRTQRVLVVAGSEGQSGQSATQLPVEPPTHTPE